MTALRKLAILGAGRMGLAIARTLIRSRRLRPGEILLADPEISARTRAKTIGCGTTPDAAAAAHSARTILLAVKPQKISEVAAEIQAGSRSKLVISILAGTPRARLRTLLPGARIVRVMPNTPLLVSRGAIVIARDGLRMLDRSFVTRLFEPMGRIFFVPERWMNAVTAVSGSGPALYCAMIESLAASGARQGLPKNLSEALAVQTLVGTGHLLENGHLRPEDLRRMVTSPGGTTEAALETFRRRRFDGVIADAIRSAVRRAAQLAR